MRNWIVEDLAILSALYLQNEECFVVRRCLHRFVAGEMSAREAIECIRQQPGVVDEDPDLTE